MESCIRNLREMETHKGVLRRLHRSPSSMQVVCRDESDRVSSIPTHYDIAERIVGEVVQHELWESAQYIAEILKVLHCTVFRYDPVTNTLHACIRKANKRSSKYIARSGAAAAAIHRMTYGTVKVCFDMRMSASTDTFGLVSTGVFDELTRGIPGSSIAMIW